MQVYRENAREALEVINTQPGAEFWPRLLGGQRYNAVNLYDESYSWC